MSTEHKDISGVNVCPAHFAAYANSAARVAATPTSAEVSKLAVQSDTGEFFRLASIGPTVWASIVGTVVAAGAALGATSLQPNTACTVSALTVTQAVATSGSPSALVVTAAAHTTLAASTDFNDLDINLSATAQLSTGNLAIGSPLRSIRVRPRTYSAVGASTFAVVSTLSLSAPIAGSLATFTNPFALYIESGAIGINHAQKIQGKSNAGTAFFDLFDWGTASPNRLTIGSPSGSIIITTSTNGFIVQTNGGTRFTVNDTSIALGSSVVAVNFISTAAAPVLTQLVDATATVTGQTIKLVGQNVSGTTAVTAGDAGAVGGAATGASGTRNGGNGFVQGGAGASLNGEAQLRNAAGTAIVRVNSTGFAIFKAPVAQPADLGAPSFSTASVAALAADVQTYIGNMRTNVLQPLGLTA